MMTDDLDLMPELPEYRDNPFINRLPAILSPREALLRLNDPPAFDEAERRYLAHVRTHCLLRMGRCFTPLERHLVLENRISALIRQGYVGRNPLTGDFLRHLQNNYERVVQGDIQASRHPTLSTASAFSLIGCSGVGKSTSVERILHLYPQTIYHSEPFSLQQVVWLKLDCPYLGSVRQLCINFFHQMDRLLGTRYEAQHGGARQSIDQMIVRMGEVADRHALGVLVVDELQHLNRARGVGAEDLLSFLVTLVNVIGIPVMTIGTLGALPLLQGAFRQARRASGLGSLVWERLEDGANWRHFIERLWGYQWIEPPVPLTDDIRQALYDESQGIVDIVIKLFMLAQLHTILLGAMAGRPERLDAGLIRHVAQEYFQLIRPMMEALRRNDRSALARYDDLRSLQDSTQQAFDNALLRLSPVPAGLPTFRKPADPAGDTPTTDDPDKPTLDFLEGQGLARDIAELMLAEVRAENPGLSPLDLIAAIVGRLHRRGPEARPMKPRQRRASIAKASPPSDERDLRVIAAKAKEDGRSVYDALLAAGVVKPPTSDVAA